MIQKNTNKILISLIILIFLAVGVIAYVYPTVTLVSPSTGSYSTSTTVEFNFSFTSSGDDYNTYTNATLFINGAASTFYANTTGIVVNGTEYNITVVLTDGVKLWNIQLLNSTNHVAWWATDNLTLTVDTTAPVAAILSPTLGGYSTADALTVTAECNDTNPNIMRLWVNGVINDTNPYASETSYTFGTVAGFSNGDNVTWAVSCTDDAGNEGFGANNGSKGMDLLDPIIYANLTDDAWWAISGNTSIAYNFTINKFIDNCTLYGDFDRELNEAGTYQANLTHTNSSDGLGVDTVMYFQDLTLYDTNDTGMYTWSIKCESKGLRSAWGFGGTEGNRTLGVDTIAPSSPDIYYISTEYYTNSTGSVRRWRNMTNYLTVTDATPMIVFHAVTDVNDITITIAFDDDSKSLASPEHMKTVLGTVSGGVMTVANNTEISLVPGRPYTRYYYALNVTDPAGNVNWSFANASTLTYALEYRLSSWGANLTASIWNPIAVARTGDVSLHNIINETGATYIAAYNKSHDFMTCSSANPTSVACYHNVSQGNPIWIYRSTAGSWDYSWWDSTRTLNPVMDSINIDYGLAGRALNFTNQSTVRWNYVGILNWSDGCTYENLQVLMNSTSLKVGLGAADATNINYTGQFNITFMSHLNISDSIYYPYYWGFGSPWNATKIPFRGVVALYLNHSIESYYNRSGC